MRRIFVALLFAAACGGKSAPATHTEHGEGSGSAASGPMMGHEGEHDDMSPEMKKFHDDFAPLWHAEKSAKRTSDTCAAVPSLQSDADAIGKATPPATSNADTWTTGTRALVAAAGKLGEACKTNDAAKFEAAFSDLHEAFHSLMGMANLHHDEHGEHGEHEHGDHDHDHEMGHGDGKGGGDHDHDHDHK